MALNVSVYFLFYSAQRVVDLPVVFFVVAADFANERHQYKETTTDDSNHNFNRHVMQVDLGTLFFLGLLLSLAGHAKIGGIPTTVECPRVHQQ